MKTFNQKIEYLLENSKSLEFKELAESLKNIGSNRINPKDLNKILIEKLSELSDKDSVINDFIVKENRRTSVEEIGITTSIQAIKESAVYSYHALRYNIEVIEKEILINKKPESIVLESYLNLIKPFDYDATVKSQIEKLTEARNTISNEILLANAIYALKNDKNIALFRGIVAKLEEAFDNIELIDRNQIIRDLNNYAFNPAVKTLLTNFKIAETNAAFNVINSSKNATVKSIYSPVFESANGHIIKVDNCFYVVSENEMTLISIDEMNQIGGADLDLAFYPVCRTIANGAKIEENKITINKRNSKIEFVFEGETKSVFINGKKIEVANESTLGSVLLMTGIFKMGEEREISDIVKTYESSNNIMEIDFAKVIESNFAGHKSAHLFNKEGKLSVTLVDMFNKSTKVNSNINGTQAVQLVKEHLNYDLSESLVEFLEVEKKALIVLESKKSEIIANLKVVESELFNLNSAIAQDKDLNESEEIVKVKSLLESEVENLKSQYRAVEAEYKAIINGTPVVVETAVEEKKVEVKESSEEALEKEEKKEEEKADEPKEEEKVEEKKAEVKEEETPEVKEEEPKEEEKVEEKKAETTVTEGDSGFASGDKVKVKGSDKVGTIASIDSTSGEIIVTVDGEDDGLPLTVNDIESIEAEVETKEEENEEKGKEESGEESEEKSDEESEEKAE